MINFTGEEGAQEYERIFDASDNEKMAFIELMLKEIHGEFKLDLNRMDRATLE